MYNILFLLFPMVFHYCLLSPYINVRAIVLNGIDALVRDKFVLNIYLVRSELLKVVEFMMTNENEIRITKVN